MFFERDCTSDFLHLEAKPSDSNPQQTHLETLSTPDSEPSKNLLFECQESAAMRKISTAAMSSRLRTSGNEEFKKVLLMILNDQNHIIQVIIESFHIEFDIIFDGELKEGASKGDSYQKEGDTLKCIQRIVKLFMRVMRKIIFWMYEDLITQADEIWTEQHLNVPWIIDSTLSEILFSSSSTLNSLVNILITRKYSEATKKLESFFRKAYKLADDKVLAENYPIFLLEGSEDPYIEVVQKISDMHNCLCPYQNFDIIISLEKEILSCANKHYINDAHMVEKLADKFDREVKIAIIMYCVLKSRNISILKNVALAEGFVSKRYLDLEQSFTSFGATLDFLLDNDENESI